MPEVLNLGMKNRNDNELNEDTEHLVFNLQNQTFSETFAFNRNKFIGSLIILNRKLNETLAIEYHTEKNRKKVKNWLILASCRYVKQLNTTVLIHSLNILLNNLKSCVFLFQCFQIYKTVSFQPYLLKRFKDYYSVLLIQETTFLT